MTKSLVSKRERCRVCRMKQCFTRAEAKFLEAAPGSRLVAYFCPANHGYHVTSSDDERLRYGDFDSEP